MSPAVFDKHASRGENPQDLVTTSDIEAHTSAPSWATAAEDGDRSNEQSPLLDASRTGDEVSTSQLRRLHSHDWSDHGEEAKSSWYLLLLTLGSLGLQVGWSVETSNGSPYLLSLGLSKSMLALVWIAGPLSGVLVQPYIGVRSDRCQSRWGRRKPFIVGGCLATIVSLLLLAWTREIVEGFFSTFGARSNSRGVQICVMLVAVIFVYVLDFAINVLQAAIRAFIVDCAPTEQQDTANAWASRMQGAGNIFGYLCGFVKLREVLPFLGNSQFKVLCAIASFTLAITSGISIITIDERSHRLRPLAQANTDGVSAFFQSLYRSIRQLPSQVVRVCWVQFAAWIGWFPFLFYISTYVGGIYTQPFFEKNPHMEPKEVDELWEKATRVGTFALLIFAITTFASSIFLPFIVAPSFAVPKGSVGTPATRTASFASSHLVPHSSEAQLESLYAIAGLWARIKHAMAATLSSLQIRTLTLRRLWLVSHIAFASAMFLSFFVRSVTAATILVGFIGLPWSVSNWAPFALISSEISKRDTIRRGKLQAMGTHNAESTTDFEEFEEPGAGVVLGIHNVAISAPQVIATLISSGIFWALQKPRGAPGDESIAWTLRFAGLCALVAAWLTTRVHEEKVELTRV